MSSDPWIEPDSQRKATCHQHAKVLDAIREMACGPILSGMPFLKEMLNHDDQPARRFFPIEFPRLNPVVQRNGLKKGTVATARKIAVILTRHWRDGTKFDRTKETLPT